MIGGARRAAAARGAVRRPPVRAACPPPRQDRPPALPSLSASARGPYTRPACRKSRLGRKGTGSGGRDARPLRVGRDGADGSQMPPAHAALDLHAVPRAVGAVPRCAACGRPCHVLNRNSQPAGHPHWNCCCECARADHSNGMPRRRRRPAYPGLAHRAGRMARAVPPPAAGTRISIYSNIFYAATEPAAAFTTSLGTPPARLYPRPRRRSV